MAKSLPDQPNLDWLKKTAKDHLAVVRSRDAAAKLHQAQLAVAHDYGFASWRALKSQVDRLSVDGRIIAAVRAGKARALAELLEAHPRKLALSGGRWNAPLLHLAAEDGHLDCVNLLLRRGAEVDKRDRTDKATALHWAAAGGHLDVAKRLLAAGADIDGEGRRSRAGCDRLGALVQAGPPRARRVPAGARRQPDDLLGRGARPRRPGAHAGRARSLAAGLAQDEPLRASSHAAASCRAEEPAGDGAIAS